MQNITPRGTKAKLKRIVKELKTLDCVFWACPGPDKPLESMATCTVCSCIKDLREVIKSL